MRNYQEFETIKKNYGEQIVKLPLLINNICFTISLVFMQNLLSTSNLDIFQRLAIILFSLALPCLGGYTFIVYMIKAAKVDPQSKGKMFLWLQYIGLFTTFLGIMITLLSVSRKAGAVFILTSVGAFLVCAHTLQSIDKTHEEVYQQKKQRPRKKKKTRRK